MHHRDIFVQQFWDCMLLSCITLSLKSNTSHLLTSHYIHDTWNLMSRHYKLVGTDEGDGLYLTINQFHTQSSWG